jgi:hypothetical protein
MREDGQQAQQPAKPAAQPQPAADPNKALVEAILKQLTPEFDKRFQPVRQTMGKLEKFQQEWSKQSKPQPQAPAVWSNLKPEEQAAYGDLISHYLQSQLGIPLTEMKEFFSTAPKFMQEYQQQRQYAQIETMAKGYAGADWDKLEPIMASLYSEASAAAKAGNESAAVWIREFETTQAGVMNAVNIARQRLGEQAQATSQKAEETRNTAAKKAGTALSNAAPTGQQFSVDSLPKGNTPQARAARMKAIEAAEGLSR